MGTGSIKIDMEISELIHKNILVQMYDILPTAYLLTPKNASDLNKFKKRFSDIHIGHGLSIGENIPEKHCKNNQWIMKPAASNQGRGIQMFSKIRDIIQYMQEQASDSQWVVQKYIEKPLLYKKRKFDIRMWALVHVLDDPTKFNIYFFEEGYLRTSSIEYNDEAEDLKVHLTNQCLQNKDKETFALHEAGNTVSFSQFQQYLDDEFPQYKVNIKEHLVTRMKDIVIDTVLSTKSTIN